MARIEIHTVPALLMPFAVRNELLGLSLPVVEKPVLVGQTWYEVTLDSVFSALRLKATPEAHEAIRWLFKNHDKKATGSLLTLRIGMHFCSYHP